VRRTSCTATLAASALARGFQIAISAVPGNAATMTPLPSTKDPFQAAAGQVKRRAIAIEKVADDCSAATSSMSGCRVVPDIVGFPTKSLILPAQGLFTWVFEASLAGEFSQKWLRP
jgi:hypothetical protein